MTLGQSQRGVGVFPTRQATEEALKNLRDANFPMNQVSVIARNEEQIAGVEVHDDTENEAGEGAAAGAVAGGVTGGIVGLIGTLIALPGVGPILVGGAAVSVIGNTLLGGAVGSAAGGLFGALLGLEVPEAEAKLYHDRLEKGDYLILVDGTAAEMTRATSILKPHGIQEWRTYERPEVNTSPVGYTQPMAAAPVGSPTPLGAAYTGPFGEPLGATPTSVTPMTPPTAPAPVTQNQRAIGVFSYEQHLKKALDGLKAAGFDMNHVSVIAKDAKHPDQVSGVKVTDPVSHEKAKDAATGTVAGGVLGGLTGLLVGLVTVAVPGVGPVVFVGSEAAAIASALGGGAIGAAAGGLVGILANLGVPEEQAKNYSDRLSHGDYLVLVQGTDEQIQQAETILRDRGIEEWDIYNSPSAPMTHPGRVFP
ncbi:general stress protein [Coleofasciculus chthonoplastes]|uniref:general stress protein n=1 Tax=Coleofasciculus chthonoplastes TaxID=64178 RepID=UPI0032F75BE8